MGNKRDEIGEEEIRIIGPGTRRETDAERERDKHRHQGGRSWWPATLAVAIAALCIALVMVSRGKGTPASPVEEPTQEKQPQPRPTAKQPTAYATVADTTVNDIPMHIFTPHNAVPMLVTGNVDFEKHPDYILGAMAADYGMDHGTWRIVGGFIHRGTLISHSVSKWGFCAILHGRVTLGRSLSTSLFEQCLAEGGDFFRHDALVSDGKVTNHNSKPRSIRRALITQGGVTSVVETEIVVSNGEFAQALAALGADQAISLVGSAYSVRWAYDAKRRLFVTGDTENVKPDAVNFIVWHAPEEAAHE